MPKKTASPKRGKGNKENIIIEAIQKNEDHDNKATNDKMVNEPLKPKPGETQQDEGVHHAGDHKKQVGDAIDDKDNKGGGCGTKRKHETKTNSSEGAVQSSSDNATTTAAVEVTEASTALDSNNDVGEKPASKDSVEGSPIDLTKPIKRARTAYFIFSDERRAEIQAKHKGEGVAVVARELGQIWSNLSPEEKNIYSEKAALEREQVAQQLEQLHAAGIDLSTLPGAATCTESSSSSLIFPLARMRKICKLDPEVRNLSKEAILLVTKCAEVVTTKLGIEAVRVAQIQNRRKLLPEDIATVCGTREQFLFLRDDVKDLVREQVAQKQKEKESNPTKAQAASISSKPLTAYFAPASGAGKKSS